MLKKYLPIILLIFFRVSGFPQEKRLLDSSETTKIDSLKQQLARTDSDSARMFFMEGIGSIYEVLNIDSSLKYTQAALTISRKHGYIKAEARIMASLSSALRQQGKFAEALDLLFKSLKIALDNNYAYDIARAYRRLGVTYADLENFPKAVAYLLLAVEIDNKNSNTKSAAIDHVLVAQAYDKMDKPDSAAFHTDAAFKAKEGFDLLGPDIYQINGSVQVKKGNYGQALPLFKEGIELAKNNNDLVVSSKIFAGLAVLFEKKNRKDSAIFYALKGFEYAKKTSFKKGIILTGNLLSELYGAAQPAEALIYFKIAAATKDSLFGLNSIQAIQDLVSREENRQKELENARLSYSNKLKLYGLVAGILALLIIAFILYRNDRLKQKANVILQQQKEKIEITLSELKATQAQLIQSEKMASLGQLTAGIAHEIQNPLNFVNNFSDVNHEMIVEAKEELAKGNISDVNLLLSDIADNEKKISFHGKRADSIVKSMLEHSRSSAGTKQPTDINALADEYLRLANHGLQRKDESFHVNLQTHFDPQIGNINLVPQEIGKVLLNLYNNAFYSVAEKRKSAGEKYEPTIIVTTSAEKDKVNIVVRDNGNGIPKDIIDKIFQPFFTTKPTGQGTGLGLSLSYDIIKAAGGDIKVESVKDEYTQFVVVLPAGTNQWLK